MRLMAGRPPKFDRTAKLVAYETGYLPVHIEEKKGTMTIVFNKDEVRADELPEMHESLKKAIPFDLILKLND
jgi:hypothetical protein